jgi:hypothetical protein
LGVRHPIDRAAEVFSLFTVKALATGTSAASPEKLPDKGTASQLHYVQAFKELGKPLAHYYTFTMPGAGTASFKVVAPDIAISIHPRHKNSLTGAEFWMNGKREAVIGHAQTATREAGFSDTFTKEYALEAGEHSFHVLSNSHSKGVVSITLTIKTTPSGSSASVPRTKPTPETLALSEEWRNSIPTELWNSIPPEHLVVPKYIMLTVGDPYMVVNGEKREIDPGRGTAPVLQDGHVMAPIRAIVESLGGSVDENEITLTYKQNTVRMTLGQTSATVNGEARTMDIPPVSINGRIMVPLRFAAENLGCTVNWVPDAQLINIIY